MQNKPLLFHLLGEASISANVLISMGNQCFYGCEATDSGQNTSPLISGVYYGNFAL